MELLAILVTLVLLQVWGSGGPLQRDGWFLSLRERLATLLPAGAPRQLGVVLLPAAGIGLLHQALHGAGYGLPELLLFVAALLYALGRGDMSVDVAEYVKRWERGDMQAAFQQMHGEAVWVSAETAPADAWELHERTRRHYFYRAYERLFAVLFWFTVLGPAGAVAYRLAALERRAAPDADSFPLLHWLDWLPVRLHAIGYALIGDFDACVDAWRPHVLELRADAARLVESCGMAAIGLVATRPEGIAQDELIRLGVREIDAIETLLRRSLVLWVAVIGIVLIRF